MGTPMFQLEVIMSTYIVRAGYTNEAFKGMMANPVDRAVALSGAMKAVGATARDFYYAPSSMELIFTVETPSGAESVANLAAISMLSRAMGTVAKIEFSEVIDMPTMVGAMKKAGELAAKYQPANKS